MSQHDECRLHYNKITSKGASVLLTTLRESNSTILELALSGNEIDDECMEQLGEFIQSNQNLQVFYVGRKITDRGIETLSKCMAGNTMLKELYLGYNEGITNKSIPLLIKLIESTHLEELLVQNSSITQINDFIIPLVHNVFKYGSSTLKLPDM